MVAPALFASLLLSLPAAGGLAQLPQDHTRDRGPESGRAWIGVSLSEDSSGADAGLEITQVVGGSPAESAGLRAGDRLMSIGGQPVQSYADLVERMRDRRPGDAEHVWVRRNLRVALDSDNMQAGRPLLGVNLGRGAYPEMVGITSVVEDSPADRAGLRAGDQVRAIDGAPTHSRDDLLASMSQADPDGSIVVAISRRLQIEFGRAPGDSAQAPRDRVSERARAERSGESPDRARVEDRLREIERARERMLERRPERPERVERPERPERPEWADRAQERSGREPLPERLEREPVPEGWLRAPDHGPDHREPRGERTQRQPAVPGDRMRSEETASLERELRELSQSLRALREELAELRHEVEALRRAR